MLTVAAVERTLRRTLAKSTIRVASLPYEAARVKIHPGVPANIELDRVHAAPLPCVLHELIHVAYYDELAKWGRLEEPVVEAIEETILRYINRDPKRLAWWRKRITAALEAA